MEIINVNLQKIYDSLESSKAKEYARMYAKGRILAKKLLNQKFDEIRSKEPLDKRFSLCDLEAENRKDIASATFGLIDVLGEEKAFSVMDAIDNEMVIFNLANYYANVKPKAKAKKKRFTKRA